VRFFVILLTITVWGCAGHLNTNNPTSFDQLNPNKPDSDAKASEDIKFSSLVEVNIPIDPKTGGYKYCLRENDLAHWKTTERNKTSFTLEEITERNVKKELQKPLIQMGAIASHFFGLAANIKMLAEVYTSNEEKSKPFVMCGNWCGPGYPVKDANPKPTDPLDEVCMLHDKCYREYGGLTCACDQILIEAIMKDRTIFDLNPIEAAIVLYISGSPCTGGCKTFETHAVCGSHLRDGKQVRY
jgi:hypothetical protein